MFRACVVDGVPYCTLVHAFIWNIKGINEFVCILTVLDLTVIQTVVVLHCLLHCDIGSHPQEMARTRKLPERRVPVRRSIRVLH